MRLTSSFAVAVAGISQAYAQFLVTELSFGYGVRFVTITVPPLVTNGVPNPSLFAG